MLVMYVHWGGSTKQCVLNSSVPSPKNICIVILLKKLQLTLKVKPEKWKENKNIRNNHKLGDDQIRLLLQNSFGLGDFVKKLEICKIWIQSLLKG